MRFNRAVALSTAAVVLPVAYIGYKYRGRASTDVAFHEGAAVNVHAPSQPLERALHALGRRVVISVTTSLSTFLLPLRSTVEVHNLDRLHRFADRPRADGAPLITVANHHSVLDDPAMMSFIAPTAADKLRWSICTEEICFQDAFPSTWFALGKALPVRRGASIYQKGLAALQDRANAGDWVHVFAEARTWQEGGTPQRDAKGRWCSASGRCGPPGATLGPLKWGVGKVVANAARAPVVVPVFHTGMAGVAPQNAQNDVMGWDLFTRHSIDIRVGEPVPVTDLLEGYHAAACERAEARNEERARRLRAARGWAGWLAGWRAPPETAAASAAADAAAAALAAALRAAALPDSHPALAPRALRAAARARALEMELRRAAPADAPPPQPLGADPRAKGMLRRFAQLESLLRPTPAGGVGDPALHYGPHRVATRMLRSGLVVPAYTEPPLRAQPPDQALLGPEDALEEEALRLELYGAIAQRIGDSLAALEQEAKRARLAAGKQ